jgi:phosphoglycolate phosphatase-like HAD superfamily hydrolase
MKKLVLFDIDRTLIKSSSSRRKVFSAAFKKVYGVDADTNIIQLSGMTDQQIIFEVLEKNGLKREIIKEKLNACMEEMIKLFDESIKDYDITVLEGVRELLSALEEKNILMGLVTGNLEPTAWAKIRKANLGRYFRVGGFGSEHINRAELVKIAIKKAQEKFNFVFDKKVYLFGDAPQDMRAGKDAGIIPFGVKTGVHSEDQLMNAGAILVFENLIDTDKILQTILTYEI